MRISDWSSDVCSSDLWGTTSVLQPVAVDGRWAERPGPTSHALVARSAGPPVAQPPAGVGPPATTGRALRRPHCAIATVWLALPHIGSASCRERVWQFV